MKQIKFHNLDLNLLRVFDAVANEGSVAQAADRLCLTPSAISHSLNRLRQLLGDELFVRGPEGMRSTPRAAEIGPKLHQLMLQLQVVLSPSVFAPAASERRFTINCGPYVTALLLPKFLGRFRVAAPSAELRVRWDNADIVDELDAGRIDIAIGGFGRLPEHFQSEILFEDRLVWAISAGHPSARKPLTLERLASLPHLLSTSAGESPQATEGFIVRHGLERRVALSDQGALARALAERGLARNVVMTVPGSVAALSVVAESDMTALVPRRHALTVARRYKLKLFDPPYPSPPIAIKLLWQRQFGEQPALAWLRSLLKTVAAEL
jgi:DNA-binding transcriptional LysR family regulator